MRKILVVLIFFIFFITPAYAVNFNATLFPPTLIEGLKNQQLNFTVTNLDNSIPILKLKIQLPEGIIFTGISDANTTNPFFSSTQEPFWWNASPIGLITPQEAVNFTIYVNVEHISGNYTAKVITEDENFATNEVELLLQVLDLVAPTYSNLSVSPSSGSSYTPGKEYEFKISWTDNVAISKVMIEHNFTGILKNDTMEKVDFLYTKKFTDLKVGSYIWRIIANDTSNNFASTPQSTYTISKAPSQLNVSLNDKVNQDIVVFVNEDLNIKIFSSCEQPNCTITIKRGTQILGTIASRVGVPVTYVDKITYVGLIRYIITLSGNENYTDAERSQWVYALPSYQINEKISEVYSPTSYTSINLTFSTDPSLSRVLIEGNWEGSFKNYTMTKDLNTYYYLAILPAGSFKYKIYIDAEGKIFKLEEKSFSIEKSTPQINLVANPGWVLEKPNVTNVTCFIEPSLPLKLYRNDTPVNNPDIQTFSAGTTVIYTCNTTGSQNYKSVEIVGKLVIKPPPVTSLEWVKVEEKISVIENSSTTISLQIKNTGNVEQNASLSIQGIDEKLFSISPSEIGISPSEIKEFRVKFSGLEKIGEYEGIFIVVTPNVSISRNFTLRILPSPERILEMNYTLSLLRLRLLNLERAYYEVKEEILNITPIENAFSELKSVLKQIEGFSGSNDYISLYKAQGYFESLLNETANLIEVSVRKKKVGISDYLYLLSIIFAVLIATVFAYKFKFFRLPKREVKLMRGDVIKYMELLEGKKKEKA